MDLSLTFCKVFHTPNFGVEINNSNIKWIATSTLSSMIMFHKCICGASGIQTFGLNVFHCNKHSLIVLQLTPFESISKSMDFNNLSCNTHRKKKLPIFSRTWFILHTHYLVFVHFCFSTWNVTTTSTCKQTSFCSLSRYFFAYISMLMSCYMSINKFKNLEVKTQFRCKGMVYTTLICSMHHMTNPCNQLFISRNNNPHLP